MIINVTNFYLRRYQFLSDGAMHWGHTYKLPRKNVAPWMSVTLICFGYACDPSNEVAEWVSGKFPTHVWSGKNQVQKYVIFRWKYQPLVDRSIIKAVFKMFFFCLTRFRFRQVWILCCVLYTRLTYAAQQNVHECECAIDSHIYSNVDGVHAHGSWFGRRSQQVRQFTGSCTSERTC